MRRLSVWSVLVLLVGCAVQNNPMPTWNGEDEGGASGSSGNAGNGGSGGSSSQAGSANKAGGGAGGKAGAGTGGDAEPQGGSGGGGKGGTAGAGGTGGKGGTGGTGGGGTGGTAGSGGSSGSGGSGGSGVDCKDAAPVTVAGLSARYVSEPGPDTAIGAQLELHYTGANPLNLADLKLRYYFTNEVTAPLQVTVNWAWYRAGEVDKKDKVVFAVVKLGCQATNADTYLEFKFKDDAGLLESNHSLILSFSASNGMGQAFTPTNDYSYDAAAKIDADYAKVAVFQNSGNRVWGAEP